MMDDSIISMAPQPVRSLIVQTANGVRGSAETQLGLHSDAITTMSLSISHVKNIFTGKSIPLRRFAGFLNFFFFGG